MSRNHVRCRACGRHIVRTHHSGRVEVLVPHHREPNGGYALICPCGEPRGWIPKEIDART